MSLYSHTSTYYYLFYISSSLKYHTISTLSPFSSFFLYLSLRLSQMSLKPYTLTITQILQHPRSLIYTLQFWYLPANDLSNLMLQPYSHSLILFSLNDIILLSLSNFHCISFSLTPLYPHPLPVHTITTLPTPSPCPHYHHSTHAYPAIFHALPSPISSINNVLPRTVHWHPYTTIKQDCVTISIICI